MILICDNHKNYKVEYETFTYNTPCPVCKMAEELDRANRDADYYYDKCEELEEEISVLEDQLENGD